MLQLLDNPLLVHSFRAWRPLRVVRGVALYGGGMLLMAVAAGNAFSRLSARLYMDELAFHVGFPLVVLSSLAIMLAMRNHFQSSMLADLTMTPLSTADIVAGLHLGMTIRMVAAMFVMMAVIPLYSEAIVMQSVSGYIVFVISACFIAELTGRMVLILTLGFRGSALIVLSVLTGLAGAMMLYGMGGVARVLPDAPWATATAGLVTAVFFTLVSIVTWREFLRLAGKGYERRRRLALEGSAEEVDARPMPRYLDRES